MVEFKTDSVTGFVSAEASSDGGLHLAFSVYGIGWEADYDFLSGIVPVFADGSYAAARKVNHVNFINHAAFMRVQADASHVNIH